MSKHAQAITELLQTVDALNKACVKNNNNLGACEEEIWNIINIYESLLDNGFIVEPLKDKPVELTTPTKILRCYRCGAEVLHKFLEE